jgi:hypothetical protein
VTKNCIRQNRAGKEWFKEMKAKLLIILCVLAIGSTTPSLAAEDPDPFYVVADVIIVRPACLVATVIGSAFFVVALPVAAISKSVRSTARSLVVKPARATFTRPLGDMDAIGD